MYEDPFSAVAVRQSELRAQAEHHRLVASVRGCSPAVWRRLLARGLGHPAPTC